MTILSRCHSCDKDFGFAICHLPSAIRLPPFVCHLLIFLPYPLVVAAPRVGLIRVCSLLAQQLFDPPRSIFLTQNIPASLFFFELCAIRAPTPPLAGLSRWTAGYSFKLSNGVSQLIVRQPLPSQT
jgi:hypothetical protein